MTTATQVRERGTAVEAFACHLCGGMASRVVVSTMEAAAGVRPATASLAYACTSRQPATRLGVVECTACHLRALHPATPPAEVERAYAAVEDPEYLHVEPHRVVAFRRLTERVARWRKPPGNLLDVGCYTGLFPGAARAAGWDAYGVEPSRWAARIAAGRLPGRITTGFLRDVLFPHASFDVVTAWDVIEHCTDPRVDLQRMAALLKPGGLLFVSTMASDAPIVRLLGRHWPWYMEMHRFYFTRTTLGRLLVETGFRVRAIEPYPHYTSLRYVFWKLESLLGPLARTAAAVLRFLGVAERTLKVDLGDFILTVAERRE